MVFQIGPGYQHWYSYYRVFDHTSRKPFCKYYRKHHSCPCTGLVYICVVVAPFLLESTTRGNIALWSHAHYFPFTGYSEPGYWHNELFSLTGSLRLPVREKSSLCQYP